MPDSFSNPKLNHEFKRIANFGGAAIAAASLGLTGINPAHADVDVVLQDGLILENLAPGDFTIFNTGGPVFSVQENGNITGTATSGINLQTDGGASVFAGANFGSTSLVGAETNINSESLVDAGTSITAEAGNDAGIAINAQAGADAGIDINSAADALAATSIRAEGGFASEVLLEAGLPGQTSSISVEANNFTGGGEVNINALGDINSTASNDFSVNANNDISLNSGRNVEVVAPNGSITLRAGTNSGTLTLTDQSATLAAPDVVLGAANGSSTVSIPGLSGANDTEILTIDPNGVVGRTPFTSITKLESKVNDVEKSLREVDSAIESIGAMALAVSAIPNLTSGDKKYGCGLGTGVFGSKWAGAAGCVAKVNQDIWINAAITYTPGVSTDYYSTPSVGGRLGAFFQF